MEMEKTIETHSGKFMLRPYRNEDETSVIALWELAFNQKMNPAIWRWKFHDNPFGRQMMLCLNESGEPVAMYAGIPFTANWNGKSIRMTQLIDNMSHPGYRQVISGRKGLFVETSKYFFELYGGKQASVYHYGFPGIKHFKLGKIFLEYGVVGDGGVYLESDLKKVEKPGIMYFGKVEKNDHFNIRFDDLWENNKVHYPFAVCRNRTFLTWRFSHHPINKYQIYSYKTANGNLKCYLVLLIQGSSASIVDIFSGLDENPFKWLIYKVKNELSNSGVGMVNIWLPKDHFMPSMLDKMGFIQKHEPLGVVPTGRCFDQALDFEFTARNIFYTMADGDLL